MTDRDNQARRARIIEREAELFQKLEMEFGAALDALPAAQQAELLEMPFQKLLLERLGPHAPAIRPDLLKALAPRRATSGAPRTFAFTTIAESSLPIGDR